MEGWGDHVLARSASTPLLWAAVLGGVLVGCGDATDVVGGEPGPICDAPEVELPDGSCLRPGVSTDGCADGFQHDGDYGCEPLLPADGCPLGLIAVPGDSECRPVMLCGEGVWGDIPAEGSNQYVDANYAGGASDGSINGPWTRVQDGVDAAAAGAIVAIAAGSYSESVYVTDKAVRIWGVCPDQVEIIESDLDVTAVVDIGIGADGSEVRGVALRGPSRGLVVSGAEDVTVDRVWVHDAGSRGIEVNGARGPTSAHIKGSLVEDSHDTGLIVWGAEATIEATAVRRTWPPYVGQALGLGISVEICRPTEGCDPAVPSSATIVGSLVEDSHTAGLFVFGSEVSVEASAIRRTWPQPSDQLHGFGIYVLRCTPDNGCVPEMPASATIVGSVVEDSHALGIFAIGADMSIDTTALRRTQPQASDQSGGRGIDIQSCSIPDGCSKSVPSSASIRGSLIEDSHDIALFVAGSELTLEGAVIRRIMPRASDALFGRGIEFGTDCTDAGCDPTAWATGTITGSLVEDGHDVGLNVVGSAVTLDKSVVRRILVQGGDGLFGDGVSVTSSGQAGPSSIARSLIADADRALVSNFGSTIALGSNELRCGSFALNGETHLEVPYAFEDLGNNECGCPTADGVCKAVSSGLTPPKPLPPFQ